jgi:hypothetical protein
MPVGRMWWSERTIGAAAGVSLSVELIELVGQQDLAAGRGYPHVHIAFLQKLLCLLQGRRRRVAAKIHAAKSIVSADQVLQLRRPIPAEQHRQTPEAIDTSGTMTCGTAQSAERY